MQSRQPTIMLVEQNPTEALAISHALEQAGRTVIHVKNLAEALAELHRDHEDLEERVQDRTRDLESVNNELLVTARRLEAHERLRSEFIDNVSHELRTPLASMSLAISNLQKGILGPLPDKLQPYLVMLAQECERLKGTVAGILDMGRIDANSLVLHHMKLPFHAWVRRAAAALQKPAEAKQVIVSVTGGEVIGFVETDSLKLERIMVSLIKNAVHYAPLEGHVEIGVARIRGETWIEMSVTDDGVGVAPEHLPRLMERYYRVGEFVSGVGLGLALCKEILDCMGGEIEILSPPPGGTRGTRVLIRLPIAPPPTVLAVDDSRTVLMLLQQHLSTHGYATQACGSAEEALAYLANGKPDLLIVDSVMPGMDGTELVAKVKANHEWRHLPVIMVTGAEVDGSRRSILEEFRIPVLGKPWKETELISCVEDAIQGKHYLER